MHILWLAGWLKAAGRKGQLLRAIQEQKEEEKVAAGFLVLTSMHIHIHTSMYKDRDRRRERGRMRHASPTAPHII